VWFRSKTTWKLRAACILLPACSVFTGERQGSRGTEEQPVNLLASMLFVWGSVAALSIAAAVLIVLGEVRLDALADLADLAQRQ
jgi:hypothetical protein